MPVHHTGKLVRFYCLWYFMAQEKGIDKVYQRHVTLGGIRIYVPKHVPVPQSDKCAQTKWYNKKINSVDYHNCRLSSIHNVFPTMSCS